MILAVLHFISCGSVLLNTKKSQFSYSLYRRLVDSSVCTKSLFARVRWNFNVAFRDCEFTPPGLLAPDLGVGACLHFAKSSEIVSR